MDAAVAAVVAAVVLTVVVAVVVERCIKITYLTEYYCFACAEFNFFLGFCYKNEVERKKRNINRRNSVSAETKCLI